MREFTGCMENNATGFLLFCSGNNHFFAIPGSQHLDFQSFNTKTGNVTIGVSVWEAITQTKTCLIPVL